MSDRILNTSLNNFKDLRAVVAKETRAIFNWWPMFLDFLVLNHRSMSLNYFSQPFFLSLWCGVVWCDVVWCGDVLLWWCVCARACVCFLSFSIWVFFGYFMFRPFLRLQNYILFWKKKIIIFWQHSKKFNKFYLIIYFISVFFTPIGSHFDWKLLQNILHRTIYLGI